jgi:serine/threonine protein kinase
MTIIAGGLFQIEEEIGRGKFGVVFKGSRVMYNKNDPEAIVAIKTEHYKTAFKVLKHESLMLDYLYKEGCRNIPLLYWFGVYKTQFSCMVMTFFPCPVVPPLPNEPKNIELCNSIMIQMIDILKHIHKALVIHRDIKPSNFMINTDGMVVLIDFGFSTFAKNEVNENDDDDKNFIIGTPKYISPFVHRGIEPSYRDDLISLGYVYMWLRTGKEISWNIENLSFISDIPDIHINHPRNQHYLKQKEMIQKFSDFGEPFYKYMNYCYSMDRTHYTYCYTQLTSLFVPV